MPIATEILALEKPENRVFAKMAPKTTSGSSFHFIFRFSVVDLVDNAQTSKRPPYNFFEKFDLKVEQEGQHPLTGQRAANLRLLANQ